MKIEDFETWSKAFDQCRERDRPIRVRVTEDSSVGTIFPSGHFRPDQSKLADANEKETRR